MCADLVELPMDDFDITHGMRWLYRFYACMDCRSRVVIFGFPNKERLVLEGYNSSRLNHFISNLKANKMMSKGLLYHNVSVTDLYHDIPSIDSVPVVNEFQVVFPDDMPEVPPLKILTFVSI